MSSNNKSTKFIGKKRSKYNAKKVDIDGYTFDSKLEQERYKFLKRLLKMGVIFDLQIHPIYQLYGHSGKIICKYEADFRYRKTDGTVNVEDVKGVKTSIYKLKAKWLLLDQKIKVIEIDQSLIQTLP